VLLLTPFNKRFNAMLPARQCQPDGTVTAKSSGAFGPGSHMRATGISVDWFQAWRASNHGPYKTAQFG